MILYHGTNNHFDEFDNDYLSTKDSIDQYGSGFYFYSTSDRTVLHGGLRITANVDIIKSIDIKDIAKTQLSYDQIEDLLLACPYLDDCLTNFGNIDYEGYDNVLHKAVEIYSVQKHDYIDILNLIGNDFYAPKDTHILLSKFVEITGIDCFTDLKRHIYVILTKKQIEIKSIKYSEDGED